MFSRAILILGLVMSCGGARADQATPWRASVFGGIATRNDTTQIFLHGHFHPDGTRIGAALDRDLADLGSHFTLVGEAAIATFLTKSDETSIDLGLGVRYDFHFLGLPIGTSLFTGPSWADDPPVISTGTWHGAPINFKKNPWLNYVGAEVALGLTPHLATVVRYYHRSGAFGIFQPNADEGSTFALGLQYRF